MKQGPNRSASGVAVWLVPSGGTPATSRLQQSNAHPRLVQKGKMFQPHVLVVPVGSVVEFPNRDPFFHNVFSLFEGKRFDLGLYEAGTTREVHFTKPGVSYIFCNIHPEMSAVVIAIPTPYYAISDAQGEIIIPNVNVGRYTLHLWYDGIPPDKLDSGTREVVVSERNATLGALQLPARWLRWKRTKINMGATTIRRLRQHLDMINAKSGLQRFDKLVTNSPGRMT